MLLKNIEIMLMEWSLGMIENILEVLFTGSEELFSPFLAGTLPDFL